MTPRLVEHGPGAAASGSESIFSHLGHLRQKLPPVTLLKFWIPIIIQSTLQLGNSDLYPSGIEGSVIKKKADTMRLEKIGKIYLLTTTTASPVDVKKAIAVNNKPISLNFKDISLHLPHYFI